MANVPYGVETLQKILIVWVGCTNVTDDRQTDGRTIHIANMNLSSRSLKSLKYCEIREEISIETTSVGNFGVYFTQNGISRMCGIYGA